MKLCLACSGGGHLRQLLLLREFYQEMDHYFLTQKTSLSESIPSGTRVHFVPDIALGKLKSSGGAWFRYMHNLYLSLKFLLKERPDVVLSTGAGTALNTLLLAKALKKKVIFLETFAHTQTPSLTGKIIAGRADAHLVQWEALLRQFPKAKLVNPLVETGQRFTPKPDSVQQTLVTIGTHGPFDRLLREVERLVKEGVIPQPVKAQVGETGFQTDAFETFPSCDNASMNRMLSESRVVITHAGTGSILSGLANGCKVIAVARRAKYGEHYDDHQLEIMHEMVERGAILGAEEVSDLQYCWELLPQFTPNLIEISPEPIMVELKALFERWFPQG